MSKFVLLFFLVCVLLFVLSTRLCQTRVCVCFTVLIMLDNVEVDIYIYTHTHT